MNTTQNGAIVEVRHLNKSFGPREILRDIPSALFEPAGDALRR